MVSLVGDSRDKCQVNISLDPASRPFYTTGDIVSGYVRVVAMSRISVSEIKVTLQCEEKTAVAVYRGTKKDIKDRKEAKKPSAPRKAHAQEKLRHYVSIQHPIYTVKGEQTLTLEKGEYTYPFSFPLSDEINPFPAYTSVYESQDLYAGVSWSIRATVHRPKITQTAIRANVDIPVVPWPAHLDTASEDAKKEATQRGLAGGFTIVQDKPGFLDLLKGQRTTSNLFEAQVSYPIKGLPQTPHKPEFGLVLRCEQLTVQVSSVELTLVQVCNAKAKQLRTTLYKEFPMGVVKLSQSLASQSLDISDIMKDKFVIPQPLVAPFSSKLLSISYEMRLTVSFVPLISKGKLKPRTLVVETPVNLQSPLEDWAQERVQNMRPLAGRLPREAFLESSMAYSSGPRSVTEGTVRTDATGTGTASSYLSYEIQRPGHVVSNVMQWFGKSQNPE